MGFFSKKSSSVKGKEAPLADYGSAQDDADLPVAHVVGVPMGFAPSATLSPATVPPATAPSGPMITNIQEKTARTQQQANIAKIIWNIDFGAGDLGSIAILIPYGNELDVLQ